MSIIGNGSWTRKGRGNSGREINFKLCLRSMLFMILGNFSGRQVMIDKQLLKLVGKVIRKRVKKQL